MITAIMISLIVTFLYQCFREGMIFDFISNWLKSWVPEKLWKPIFSCPICMTPWWGTIIYWIFFHISITHWILVVLVASGISTIFVYIHQIADSLIDISNKYNEQND